MFGDGHTVANTLGNVLLVLLIGGMLLSLMSKLSSYGQAMGPGRKTLAMVTLFYLTGVVIATGLLSFFFWAPMFGGDVQDCVTPTEQVTETVEDGGQ